MLRYCEKHKKWYIYENGRWVVDTSEMRVHNKVQVLLRLLELYCDESQKDLSEYKKTVRKCMSDPIVRRILHNSRFKMMVDATDFDSDPYLLNCTNGVYDMQKQSFRFATPEDYFTLSTSCAFPTALYVDYCDRWYTFVDEITEGNK
jgi:putative DNA primase/helicase